jgi:hypothetical protein
MALVAAARPPFGTGPGKRSCRAALAACIGPYAPPAFLVCGAAIGGVATCFAEGGSRMPTGGAGRHCENTVRRSRYS